MQKYLSQEVSRLVDERLMSELGFSIDQLMELAGLSVAESITKEFPPCKVLVVCGPGNNGGDGLVAARHLKHFGYLPTVFYPKSTTNQLYLRLITQCNTLTIPVINSTPFYTEFDLIVDGIFGFSFKGDIRAPFDGIIRDIKNSQKPLVSIDIPSGWDVEQGNVTGFGLEPQMLISLTAAKQCAQFFKGIHYIGGRFVPPSLAQEFNFEVPPYSGSNQSIKIS
ncbi:hypothetical protein SteCoe_25519 [Stentor coeruleus]|uniref:NAD(P)H-hydrate epimerase n=1 Tax=Stentor coeruleus TaxID=5963 RepID=A0A1R2BF23_9CILI|nr:hypothetical protein SteCoe_25519 [Stentor coeruleus]